MNQKHVLVVGAALTAINLAAVAVNLSTQAVGKVAGKDRRDLYQDTDFRWAVEDVIADCSVDGTKIQC
ncbi:hypothetical protein [Bradyrhizobium sp.]|uniref:hypothetical protein n=1 Tax=Bradyrhizobium sp. TaxID=376 RepID=UPI00403790AB